MIKKIKLTFVGDILCWEEQNNLAYDKKTNTYDYSRQFSEVKKYFSDSNYVVGNLETTFSGEALKYTYTSTENRYSKIMFNTPETFAKALKETGFDLLTTANNHTMDRGVEGVIHTLKTLNQEKLEHIGTYTSLTDRNNIFIKDINGIRIAFLTYTHGINYYAHHHRPTEEQKDYLVNMLARPESQAYEFATTPEDISKPSFLYKLYYYLRGLSTTTEDQSLLERILQDFENVKRQNPDIIVVLPHMGTQYKPFPSSFSRKWVKIFFNAGADIVIAGHPHVIEPMRVGKGNKFVIYSMGNFITSPLYDPAIACTSIILHLIIEKDEEGRVNIKSVEFTPTWVQCRDANGELNIRVLSSYDAYNCSKHNLSTKERESVMKNTQLMLKHLLGFNPNNNIKEVYSVNPKITSQSPKTTNTYFILCDVIDTLKKLVYLLLKIGAKFYRKIYPNKY